ncbi:MAG: methionyl-tRNA formyltransferase [Planctomycetes bacterium]|uniref:methionyl-tRNA formyltransferase n=1 Tax=Candidatus Wunengus sp. YC65 TaxID=3367701 RepID=UPI001DA6D20A|nr:methionyl-tRNA formyltransferase [Planctomycetota bacterium]
MNYVIAFSHERYHNIFSNMPKCAGREFIILNGKDALTFEKLSEIKPKYVFFPHWSYIIPSEIYENFECIIFHMTDVPFGRGGSPLQNLISRGIYETKISALKCSTVIDAGPVYIKRPLSLYGSAEEIYLRAGKLIKEMMIEIIEKEPVPDEQKGEPIYFARRKPDDGNITPLKELNEVYDYIRMLDADGYPNAFLETEYFKLEFQRPALKSGKLVADVIITQKQKDKDE